MKIQIKGKIYLESDERQFLLKEYSGKQDTKGNDLYKVLGYYGKLDHAISKILHMKLVESRATTLKELMEEFKQIEKDIRTAISV